MLFRNITTEERQALALWFEAAFNRKPENDQHYFAEMVQRYENGTLWCYADQARRNCFEGLLLSGKLYALELEHLQQFDAELVAKAEAQRHCHALRALAIDGNQAGMVLEELEALASAIKTEISQSQVRIHEAQAKVERLVGMFDMMSEQGLRYWLERILVYQQEDAANVSFVALQVEQQVGIAHRDQRGYTPANIDYTGKREELEAVVQQLNQEALGHSPKEAMQITFSTMRA